MRQHLLFAIWFATLLQSTALHCGGEDCSWTQQWSCPGQPTGSKGVAKKDETKSYQCCCIAMTTTSMDDIHAFADALAHPDHMAGFLSREGGKMGITTTTLAFDPFSTSTTTASPVDDAHAFADALLHPEHMGTFIAGKAKQVAKGITITTMTTTTMSFDPLSTSTTTTTATPVDDAHAFADAVLHPEHMGTFIAGKAKQVAKGMTTTTTTITIDLYSTTTTTASPVDDAHAFADAIVHPEHMGTFIAGKAKQVAKGLPTTTSTIDPYSTTTTTASPVDDAHAFADSLLHPEHMGTFIAGKAKNILTTSTSTITTTTITTSTTLTSTTSATSTSTTSTTLTNTCTATSTETTSLISDAKDGALVLAVPSGGTGTSVPPCFRVADWIIIASGTVTQEVNQVAGFGSGNIILARPLKFDHLVGTSVGATKAPSMVGATMTTITTVPVTAPAIAMRVGVTTPVVAVAPTFPPVATTNGSQQIGSNIAHSWQQFLAFLTGGATFLAFFLVNAVLVGILGTVYKLKVVDKVNYLENISIEELEVGAFDCVQNPHYCLMATFCPCIRAAHTNDVTNIFSYWKTLVLMVTSVLCICGPCCLNIYFRSRLLGKFGIKNKVRDSCLAVFCWQCTTGQQALEVDRLMGHEYTCPCGFGPADGSNLSRSPSVNSAYRKRGLHGDSRYELLPQASFTADGRSMTSAVPTYQSSQPASFGYSNIANIA